MDLEIFVTININKVDYRKLAEEIQKHWIESIELNGMIFDSVEIHPLLKHRGNLLSNHIHSLLADIRIVIPQCYFRVDSIDAIENLLEREIGRLIEEANMIKANL